MKNYLLGLLIIAAFYSCNKNSRNLSYSAETETAETTAKKPEDCINEKATVVAEPEDSTYENLSNMGGYNYSYTPPKTDFQGASGYGTGSSYASNYYAASEKKTSKKVCAVESTQEVEPETMEHASEESFYTVPSNKEKTGDTLQEETEMEWNNRDTTELDSGSDQQSVQWITEEQSDNPDELWDENTSADSDSVKTESGNNSNFDELPW